MGSEFSMSASEAKAVRRRLNVLELAEKLGNVSEACRQVGVTRSQFYEYRQRYRSRGLEGLMSLRSGRRPQAPAAGRPPLS